MANPRLFVSYSWTNPSHEEWVVKLASELREDGIDVVLDKWDLKEGHDANAFMERMVVDATITKVVLVCDEMYVQKANTRKGGVGAEAQIISPDLYSKQDQNKFCAIVVERDPDGKPYLPTYYRSRIYIDLSDPSSYSEGYDKLLRWIYDSPLYEKPPIGSKPSFLAEDAARVQLGTATRFRRGTDSIKNGRPNAQGATAEYLATLSRDLEKTSSPRRSGGLTNAAARVW